MESGNCKLKPVFSCSKVMKVLLDARKFNDGGIGVYTRNLIEGLLAQDTVKLTLIVGSDLAESKEFQSYKWHSQVSLITDEAGLYSYDEFFRLSKRINFSEYDIFHVPHYTLPFGIKIPTVITVHDLIQINRPEKFFYPLVCGTAIKSGMKRADRILTVSQSTFEELCQFVGHRSKLVSRMRVVPNALDPYFLKKPAPEGYLNHKFSVSGKYLFAAFSNLKPHKGLSDLLKAFHAVKKRGRLSPSANGKGAKLVGDLKLVLAGKGTEALVESHSLLEHAGSTEGVYVLGAVTREELLNLYGRALAVVIPSNAEGFCLPALEAHAQGTPIVCRPVPALKELKTDRDIICQDFGLDSLESGITQILDDYIEGNNHRGWPNLQKYSCEDIGKTVLRIYDEVLTEADQ